MMNPAERKVIRVLVVEDSQTIAELLTHVLNSDPGMRVAGVVSNGEDAVEAVLSLRPDIITMDIHMPKVNGFEATRRIMETCPVPIVIVSGSSTLDEVAMNFRALEAGALAVASRPATFNHSDHEASANELLKTVRLMSDVKVVRRWPRSRMTPALRTLPLHAQTERLPGGAIHAVAIGASTGGPLALQTVLSGLPKDFPVPVLIVQHMTPGFGPGFVEWLSRASGFPVRIAVNGELLEPGRAYVAPDHFHMGITNNNRILLSKSPVENGTRPSVSFLFRSVKETFGTSAVCVLLTGMGKDGVDELKLLRNAGAITIAQDKESSVVYGMPGEAAQIDAAVHVLPPEAIARMLLTLVTKP